MKKFVCLILLICFVISYNAISTSKPEVKCKTCDGWKDLRIALENLLHVKVKKLKSTLDGRMAINGVVYETEEKKLLFVKFNSKPKNDRTFQNEFEGLKAIRDTNTILAPRPIATGRTEYGQNFIVMEYMNMTTVNSKSASELGSQLADMHLCNLNNKCGKKPAVKKFGFHTSTDIDMIPQNNSWRDDWITFFKENRMDYQVSLLRYSDDEYTIEKENVVELYWPQLRPHVHKFFEGIDIKPSLLHGNLWTDNMGEWNSKPVIYDPSVFYGHHEFDIAGAIHFNKSCTKFFHNTYFKKIPRAAGHKNRILLYQLYYELNHWNFFGGGYAAINSFLDLLKICEQLY